MLALSKHDWWAWGYVLLLTVGMVISFSGTMVNPMDDHFYYQKFIETLAAGRLDLTIPGFHGMNILVVPYYLFTGSPIAQIEFQMLSGMLLPALAYLAGRHLFKSVWYGVMFATIIALMPFLTFSSLRGWMVATYHCLVMLTIYGAAKKAWWTWLAWGFSIISLPFSVALLPLLIYLRRQEAAFGWSFAQLKTWLIANRQIIFGLAIPVAYVLIQIAQAGQVNVGVHKEFDQMSIWSGPERWFLNAVHSLQIMFSVHNYYFLDPAKTGHGNMMHTTPILVFLGLYAILSPKDFFKNKVWPFVLLLGAVIGIGLNIALDHMDDFYMETGVLFLIFAALPVLKKHILWIPLVLATLHFQWFYFYLQFYHPFQLKVWFFAVPVIVDLCFILYSAWHWRSIKAAIKESAILPT